MKYIRIRTEEVDDGDLSKKVKYATAYEEKNLFERTKLGEVKFGNPGSIILSEFYTEDCFLLMSWGGAFFAFNIKTKEKLYEEIFGTSINTKAILSEDKKLLYIFSSKKMSGVSIENDDDAKDFRKRNHYIYYLSLEDFSIVRAIKIPIPEYIHHFEKFENHFLFYYNNKEDGQNKYFHHYDLIEIETGAHARKILPNAPWESVSHPKPILDLVNGKGIMPYYGDLERAGEKVYLKIMIFDLHSFEVENIIAVRLYKPEDLKVRYDSDFLKKLLGSPKKSEYPSAYNTFVNRIKTIVVDEQRACLWLQFEEAEYHDVKYRRVGYDGTMSVLYTITTPAFKKEGYYFIKENNARIQSIREGRILMYGDLITKEYGFRRYHLPFMEEAITMEKEIDLEKTETLLLKEISPLKTVENSNITEVLSTELSKEIVSLKSPKKNNSNKSSKRKIHVGGIPFVALSDPGDPAEEKPMNLLGLEESDKSYYREFTDRKEFLEHFYKEHEKFEEEGEVLVGYYHCKGTLEYENGYKENVTWVIVISPDIFQVQKLRKLTMSWASNYEVDASIIIIDEEKSEVAHAITRLNYEMDHEVKEHSIYYNGKFYKEYEPLKSPMGLPDFKVEDWTNLKVETNMPIYCEKPGTDTLDLGTLEYFKSYQFFYVNNFSCS